MIGNGVKRLSRPGASDRSDRLLLEPGLPPGGPRSAMTGTGVLCPRSTLEGRRVHRPCWIQLLIHRPRRPRHLKTPTQPRLQSSRRTQCVPRTSSYMPSADRESRHGHPRSRVVGEPKHARACLSTFECGDANQRGERAAGQRRQARAGSWRLQTPAWILQW